MHFKNTYEDARRASAYDELGYGGTYELVFRKMEYLLREHVSGDIAVDFGCGTGRSTRFLHQLNFRTIGIDISPAMVALARERDPLGDYRVIEDGDFSSLEAGTFDLAFSAFTFDNIPGRDRKVKLMTGLRRLLNSRGLLVNIVSTPEIYTHEWVTFSTRDYPENALAQSGDVVRIVTTDYSDSRPVDDILWTDNDYRSVFRDAGLEVKHFSRPLAGGDEGIAWVSETRIAPWSIYLLRKAKRQRSS